MRSIVKVVVKNNSYYLSSLYPCKWTEYISCATFYDSYEDARSQLNGRVYQLASSFEDEDFSIDKIVIITYDEGKVVDTRKYLERGGIR